MVSTILDSALSAEQRRQCDETDERMRRARAVWTGRQPDLTEAETTARLRMYGALKEGRDERLPCGDEVQSGEVKASDVLAGWGTPKTADLLFAACHAAINDNTVAVLLLRDFANAICVEYGRTEADYYEREGL